MTAPGYGCADDECRNPVNWLLTHMKPPGTLSVCDEHFAVFAIGLLAGDLGVDNARLYDVIRKHVDREAAKAAKAAAAEQAAQASHAEQAQDGTGHAGGITPMSPEAAEQTESGGLVIDRGATP